MDREPPNGSMGVFAMYKEAFKITFTRKKIFSQIFLAILLPLTIILLSQLQVSHYIGLVKIAKFRWLAYCTSVIVYSIFVIVLAALSTSSVVYAVACIYTSRDITFKRVFGIFPKVNVRVIVTLLWCLLIGFIYLGVVIGLLILVHHNVKDEDLAWIFKICLINLFSSGLPYMANVWSIAMVMSVLENDYGRKALGKSKELVRGKNLDASVVLMMLYGALTGVVFAFSLLVVDGHILSLVGKIFVGIACYLAVLVLVHFTLVMQTIVYFVCKSHHNEDLSSVAKHLDVADSGGERDDIEQQRASAV